LRGLTFEERYGISRRELREIITRARLRKSELEERERMRWSREKAIAIAQDFADFHGRNPTAADLRRNHGLPAYQTVVKLFGSLKNLLVEAGLRK
jgi:hypothetical protein